MAKLEKAVKRAVEKAQKARSNKLESESSGILALKKSIEDIGDQLYNKINASPGDVKGEKKLQEAYKKKIKPIIKKELERIAKSAKEDKSLGSDRQSTGEELSRYLDEVATIYDKNIATLQGLAEKYLAGSEEIVRKIAEAKESVSRRSAKASVRLQKAHGQRSEGQVQEESVSTKEQIDPVQTTQMAEKAREEEAG